MKIFLDGLGELNRFIVADVRFKLFNFRLVFVLVDHDREILFDGLFMDEFQEVPCHVD